jgi:glycine oxidase
MPPAVDTVIVVGAGVVGCACALALARRGAGVTLLERGAARLEAPGETGVSTWAAAGILGAQIATREDGPLARLGVESRRRYPAYVAAIQEETGLDVELRPAGVLRPAFDEGALADLRAEVAWQERAGLRVEHLDAAATRAIEPALSPGVVGAVRFPDDLRIDPPSLLVALRAAAARAGVRFRAGSEVRRVIARGGRARAVELADGATVEGDAVVLAAGSWTSLVEGASLAPDAVRPARGQMVEVRLPSQILHGVVEGARGYLSPRDDGRVLVGSTVEHVGYRLGATAGVVRDLLAAATELAPALADATVTRAWAGLRPYTPGEVPLIGATATAGLFLATGHFRNGVLLAPVTGEIIADLVTGSTQGLDASAFSPSRAAGAA